MKKIVCPLGQLLIAMSIIIAAPGVLDAQSTSHSSTAAAVTSSPIMSDTAFISKNIMDNTMELQLAQLGTRKSTDQRVKNVAQQMVTDHSQILYDLKRVARQKNMAESSWNHAGSAVSGMGSTTGMTSGSTGTTGITLGSGTGMVGTGATSGASTSGAGITSGSGTGTSGMAGSAGISGVGTISGNRTSATGSRVNTTSGSTTGASGAGMSSGTGASGTSVAGGTATGTSNAAMGSGTGTTGMTGGAGASGGGIISGTGTGTSATTSSVGMAHGTGAGMSDMRGMSGMQDMNAAMEALQNASGTQFNSQFISQMLTMHDAKIAELESALRTISDPILKAVVTNALPKIRMHRDMLSRMNRTSGGSDSGNSGGIQQ